MLNQSGKFKFQVKTILQDRRFLRPTLFVGNVLVISATNSLGQLAERTTSMSLFRLLSEWMARLASRLTAEDNNMREQ